MRGYGARGTILGGTRIFVLRKLLNSFFGFVCGCSRFGDGVTFARGIVFVRHIHA